MAVPLESVFAVRNGEISAATETLSAIATKAAIDGIKALSDWEKRKFDIAVRDHSDGHIQSIQNFTITKKTLVLDFVEQVREEMGARASESLRELMMGDKNATGVTLGSASKPTGLRTEENANISTDQHLRTFQLVHLMDVSRHLLEGAARANVGVGVARGLQIGYMGTGVKMQFNLTE